MGRQRDRVTPEARGVVEAQIRALSAQGKPLEAALLHSNLSRIELAQVVTDAIEATHQGERRGQAKALLSFREAARRLGIDRGRTLSELVARGELKVVDANGRKKVPATEVERLAREGFDVTGPAPKAKASKRQARSTAAAIRAIKL